MEHSYYQERLSAYLDRELPLDEAKAVEEHLAGCEECSTRLGELEKLDQFAGQNSDLDESDYWEESAAKIEAMLPAAQAPVTDIRPKRSGLYAGLWWKLPAVAASVLFVGYIGLHESEILKGGLDVPPQEQLDAESPSSLTDEATEPDSVGIDLLGNQSDVRETEPAPVDAGRPVVADEPVDLPSAASAPPVRPEESETQLEESAIAEPVPTAPEPTRVQRTSIAPSTTAGQVDGFVESEGEVPSAKADESNYRQPELKSGSVQAEAGTKERTKSQRVATGDETPVKAGEESLDALTVPPAPADKVPSTEVTSEERQKIRSMMEQSVTSFDGGAAPKIVEPERVDLDELAEYRLERDSLQAILDSLGTTSDKRPDAKLYSVGKTKRGGRSAATPSSGRVDRTEVEAALVDIWFDICEATDDKVERNRGIDYLRQIADDRKSKLRDKARHYLELLDR